MLYTSMESIETDQRRNWPTEKTLTQKPINIITHFRNLLEESDRCKNWLIQKLILTEADRQGDEYFIPTYFSVLILQTKKQSVFIGTYFVENIAGQFIFTNIWVLRWWWNRMSCRGFIYFDHCRPTNDRVIFIRK